MDIQAFKNALEIQKLADDMVNRFKRQCTHPAETMMDDWDSIQGSSYTCGLCNACFSRRPS